MRNVALFLSLLFFALLTSPISSAQNIDDQLNTKQRALLNDIESSILSPFCTGRLLKDCPSSAGNDLRRQIKEEILAGTPKEKILENLFKEYGEELHAVPEVTGFGSVAWFAPLVFLFIGLLVIVNLVKRPGAGEDSP